MPPPLDVSLHQPDRSSLSPTPSPVKPRKESNTPLSVKPSIAELLRTAHHPPSITLVVASIKIIPVSDVPSSALQTFHLHLTDSEYIIQAVFMPQMHRFVITEDVVEGSVLQLVEYDIRIARRKRDHSLTANTTHGEKVAYLAIRDFHTLGCRPHWRDIFPCRPSTESVAEINGDGNRADDELSPVKIHVKRTMQTTPRRWRPYHTQPSQGRNHQAKAIIQYDTNEDEREPLHHLATTYITASTTTTANISARITRPPQFQHQPHSHTYPRGQRPTTQPIRPTTITPTPPMKLNLNNPNPNLPNPSPPLYPTLITPLSKIPHLRPHHTLPLTILAIPISISPTTIQRPRLGTKRDIRLVDMSLLGPKPSIPPTTSNRRIATSTGVIPAISTTRLPDVTTTTTTTTTSSFIDSTSTPTIGHMKGIQLSVWVDADGFLPETGRVALARGVRSHPWEGGSLNAWGRWCGVDWWVDRESNTGHMDGDLVDEQQGLGPGIVAPGKEELGMEERREEGTKREMGLNPRGMVLNPREMVQKQRHVARDGIQMARTTTRSAMQPIDSAVLLQMQNLQRWWDTEGKLVWGVVDANADGSAVTG